MTRGVRGWIGWLARPWRQAGRGLVALLLLAGLMLAVGLAQAWAIRFARGEMPGDTLGYYTGALMVARGEGERLYDPSVIRATQSALLAELPAQHSQDVRLFLNPPFVAALFLPLALLPVERAYAIWGIANWVLAIVLAALCAATASSHGFWGRALWFLGALTFAPVYAALLTGQVSLVLASAALGGWLLLRRRHALLAGLLLAGLLIKPQYAGPVVLGLCLGRQWRALSGFAAGAVGAALLSLLAVGWSGALSYLRFLPQMGNLWPDYGWNPAADYTWRGLATRLLGPGLPADILWAGLTATTLALMLATWRSTERGEATQAPLWAQDARFAALLLWALLISPHTFPYDLAMLVPAGVVAWRGLRDAQGRDWMGIAWLGIGILAWAMLGAMLAFLEWYEWYGVGLVVPMMSIGVALLVWGGRVGRGPATATHERLVARRQTFP